MRILSTYTKADGTKMQTVALTPDTIQALMPSQGTLANYGLMGYPDQVDALAEKHFADIRAVAPAPRRERDADHEGGRPATQAPLTQWVGSRNETYLTAAGRALQAQIQHYLSAADYDARQVGLVESDMAALMRRLTDDSGAGDLDGPAGFEGEFANLSAKHEANLMRLVFNGRMGLTLAALFNDATNRSVADQLVGRRSVEVAPAPKAQAPKLSRAEMLARARAMGIAGVPAAEPSPEVAAEVLGEAHKAGGGGDELPASVEEAKAEDARQRRGRRSAA